MGDRPFEMRKIRNYWVKSQFQSQIAKMMYACGKNYNFMSIAVRPFPNGILYLWHILQNKWLRLSCYCNKYMENCMLTYFWLGIYSLSTNCFSSSEILGQYISAHLIEKRDTKKAVEEKVFCLDIIFNFEILARIFNISLKFHMCN